ncbi:carbohydrate ABC transporter permease [Paenibacillus arenilitoris]|uniref:Carbohydrate ABC transporter permease n=1 Tax=Paenibacillus arenilitoris TaxID=2772299 RepID=A0A927CJG5_9BACL|nr:carbohydrate ABC transporter permease [Paenibacillus arenilitoris]MBD2868590.1 carbohydrate ABC transporter permease [Paenibacillus arenilitoris]
MTESRGEKIFYAVNYVVLSICALAALYPFLYVLFASISSPEAVVTGEVVFLPQDLTWDAYAAVFKEQAIWTGYANTVYYTVIGTLASMAFTICGAYALSKRRLLGRKLFNMLIAFTLIFQAGMIPTYLNFRSMDMLDTRLAIVLGFAITTFNVIILRTFFQEIPEEMEEAARMDGAGEASVLWRIVLPLSRAALATIALFYAVARWNGYLWAMILLKDPDKIPLQVLLNRLVVQMKPTDTMLADSAFTVGETIVYATIIVAVVPIVAVYPFIQKYFVKGVMIGSLKG